MPMLTNGGGLIFLIAAGFMAWYVRDSWRRSQPAQQPDPAPTCVILCADQGHDAIFGQHLAHAAHCCDCDELDRELAELVREREGL